MHFVTQVDLLDKGRVCGYHSSLRCEPVLDTSKVDIGKKESYNFKVRVGVSPHGCQSRVESKNCT